MLLLLIVLFSLHIVLVKRVLPYILYILIHGNLLTMECSLSYVHSIVLHFLHSVLHVLCMLLKMRYILMCCMYCICTCVFQSVAFPMVCCTCCCLYVFLGVLPTHLSCVLSQLIILMCKCLLSVAFPPAYASFPAVSVLSKASFFLFMFMPQCVALSSVRDDHPLFTENETLEADEWLAGRARVRPWGSALSDSF